ncbi:cytochrome b [Sphingomonas kaistensis]|uniref:Cytochrome b n=1 Tax=Sphingomonas kaistensis TaxID=298708 RepID=A0ABZ2G4R6_9SPHN
MTARYTQTAAWLHWVMAALIIANLVIGLSDGAIGSIRAHKAIGLTVLALALVRLAWRLAHRPPPLPADTSPAERRLAGVVHAILYGLMIAVPLAGWIMVSNASELRPLTWFGLFDLPFLQLDPAAYAPAKAIHSALGIAFGLLVLGHIAAALRHQFVKRDHLLDRMTMSSTQPGQ